MFIEAMKVNKHITYDGSLHYVGSAIADIFGTIIKIEADLHSVSDSIVGSFTVTKCRTHRNTVLHFDYCDAKGTILPVKNLPDFDVGLFALLVEREMRRIADAREAKREKRVVFLHPARFVCSPRKTRRFEMEVI